MHIFIPVPDLPRSGRRSLYIVNQ